MGGGTNIVRTWRGSMQEFSICAAEASARKHARVLTRTILLQGMRQCGR